MRFGFRSMPEPRLENPENLYSALFVTAGRNAFVQIKEAILRPMRRNIPSATSRARAKAEGEYSQHL